MSEQLLQYLIKLDQKKDNPYLPAVVPALQRAINANQIELLLFTCSTIRAEKMFSKTPWEYVSVDPTGNNLEQDLSTLRAILAEIKNRIPTKLTVLIGNTDPYYIYLQQFRQFSQPQQAVIWKKFIERWEAYQRHLATWIEQRLPEICVQTVSWYALEKQLESQWQTSFTKEYETVYQNIENYFSTSDLDWEFQQLSQQFKPGKYFATLTKPADALLNDWVRRKFAEYALQGAWLARAFPNAVLIQNEKPSDLRSKMYQPVLLERTGQILPIISYLGVDNQGYA